MRKLGKYIGVLAALLLFSGSAWAYNLADHCTLAENNAGDLMFYKYYVTANGGWETKISVTNTAIDRSVVAKVVFRSIVNSTELLDFLIYLSPGDMWNGHLYFDGTDTKIYSEDSSCLNAAGQWASATAPLDYALKTIGGPNMVWCPLQDTTTSGYIYVVQAAYSTDNAGSTVGNFGTPGVSKALIKANYEKGTNEGGTFKVWPALGTATVGTTWSNTLSGYQVFYNSVLGLFSAADNPVFIKNYKSQKYLGTGQTNRLGTYTEANNSLGEIEAILAKTNISMPYIDDANNATVHIIGFPTKYTTSTKCTLPYTFAGPFFASQLGTSSATAALTISDVTVWDVNENFSSSPFSPSPSASWRNEVTLLAASDLNVESYPEGWIQYPMTYGTTATTMQGAPGAGLPITYTGTPMTTSIVHFGSADAWGFGGIAYTPPTITVAGQPVTNYQVAVAPGS